MSDVAQLPAEAAPSPEYVAQMTAATHTDPTPAGFAPKALAAPERPAHVPEKFWDATKGEARWEDLAKSYSELEGKLAAGTPPVPELPKPDAQNTAKVEAPKEEAAPAFLTPMTTLAEAYATGAHTEEHIAAVEAAGIPRQFIDTYMAGVKALEQLGAQEVFSYAGGEDQFKAAQAWAVTGLTAQELEGYNAICDQPATRKQAVEWLMSKFSSARPGEGSLVQTTTSSGVGDVFNSVAEQTAAFSDPRYKADPAYRQQVAEKLLRSQRAGTLTPNAEYHRRGR
jgi:hypothetical protein